MLSIPKPLRILLPVATATAATIFTVYLVAAFTKELNKKHDEDTLLDNLDLETKPFEEELIENKEQSEGTEKEEKTDSKPNDSEKNHPQKPEDKKELSHPENSPPNLDQIVDNLRDQVANTMEKAKDLQEVSEMTLQIPDEVKSQSSSDATTSKVSEPNQDSGLPSAEEIREEVQQAPSDKNLSQDDGDSRTSKEKPDLDSGLEGERAIQEEQELVEREEETGTKQDLSDQIPEPEENGEDDEKQTQEAAKNSSLDGGDSNQEPEEETSEKTREADGAEYSDGSQGEDEAGSDNESVTMTAEQIEQLLN